jgi:predicted alpha-1,2-mannosidase
MVGDPAAPFFAAAYNQGIRNYDAQKAYEGLRKNALPGGLRDHAGYERGEDASGGGMNYYVERGYVPEGIRSSGLHRNGASLTLEYAYQDWCLGQFAKALGRDDDAQWLLKRSQNYRNLWDPSVRWMRPRKRDGSWYPDFAAAGPVAGRGFTEANSAIYTHYVPHDVAGLVELFDGPDRYVAQLNEQFEQAAAHNFVVERGQHQLGWVGYDNQPSMAMAHLFNLAGAPWLSQKWVRAVKERALGDTSPAGGYHGDEDQGQLGALGVLMAIGLFDVRGGAALNPSYQITTPLFDRVTIELDSRYYPGRQFTIITTNNSPRNIYIQRATLNGKPLQDCSFPHSVLVGGGTLELELSPEPNRIWGVTK